MRKLILAGVAVLMMWSTAQVLAKPKYAMAVYHFNLQYVAGDQRIERRIVRECIIPLLEFYERNPRYKGDFEIQAWALEVLHDEFPGVLARLRALIEKGQLELVVAHYSDQFFIAYPALDMQRSVELSDRVLKRLNLERSRVFFAQELQWTPGLASALAGKYDIVVTSSDPYGYYWSDAMPLYEFEYAGKRMLVLVGGGRKDLSSCRWEWAFFDDGEVFSTRDYLSDFYRVPEWEQEHIQRFKDLERQGYEFLTVTEFVERLKRNGYRPPKLPYLPEGTWNMSGGGPYNWMGRQGGGNETDGPTRAASFRTRGWVMVAEAVAKLVDRAGQELSAVVRKVLELAWKHHLLGEVSDSSGWSPLPVEVRYTAEECATAEQAARVVITEVLRAAKLDTAPLRVDTRTGKVEPDSASSRCFTGSDAYPPVPVLVRASEWRVRCRKFHDDLYRIEVRARKAADGAVEIALPLRGNVHQYSAPLGEDSLVTIPTDLKHDPILSLSNGLFTLGDGWNLIKDNAVEHLAATWRYAENRLVFREELRRDVEEARLVFYLYRAKPRQALEAANRLNVWPMYRVWFTNGTAKLERIPLEELLAAK